jgi:hypothetical protein
MRRPLIALTSFASLTAALFAVACEDDPSAGPGGGFSSDGGTFEASSPSDAGVPPPDASRQPDAAAPTTIAVRVTQQGKPLADVRVVFHDASGAVASTVKTAADGRAVSSGPVPAMASALLGRGDSFHVVTWTAVEAGDELLVEEQPPALTALPSLDVSFPLLAGATSYQVAAGACTGVAATSPVRVALAYAECVRPDLPILARARDGNAVDFFAFDKSKAAPTDGGVAAVALGAFSAGVNATVDVTNGPGEKGSLGIGMTEIVGGVGVLLDSVRPKGASATFRVPTGFADARQVYASFDSSATSGAHQSIVRREAPGSATTIDFAQRLPKVTEVTVPEPVDPQRFEITWTSDASLSGTDGGLVRVRFFTKRDVNLAWSFVVPPTAGTSGKVKAPAMPAEAAGWIPDAPDAGGAAFDAPNVLFVESSAVPSYAAFRRVAATVVDRDAYGPRELSAVLPQNGTLRGTAYWVDAR